MGARRGDLRESDTGPRHPTKAWVERPDGSVVRCDLVRTGRHTWTATPCDGRVVTVGEGDHLQIDRLGPGDRVAFVNVLGEQHFEA